MLISRPFFRNSFQELTEISRRFFSASCTLSLESQPTTTEDLNSSSIADNEESKNDTTQDLLSDKELWDRKKRADSQYDKWEFKCPTTLHRPFTRVKHPTGPADLTLALLLASQAHLGHSPSLWNTKTQAYIYGIRQGVHIISLDATLSHLKLAASVVRGVSANGGLILFVGTRSGQDQAIVGAARRTGGYHLFHRWLPGAITNGEYVIGRGRLKAEPVDPRKLEFGLPPQPPVIPKALKPDLVVIMNPLENHVLLRECTAHRIPTIGIIDTNADPSLVTYAIPANDDSLRCVEVIAGTLGRAGEDGRLEREARDKRRNMRIAMKEIKAVDGKVTIRVAEHA